MISISGCLKSSKSTYGAASFFINGRIDLRVYGSAFSLQMKPSIHEYGYTYTRTFAIFRLYEVDNCTKVDHLQVFSSPLSLLDLAEGSRKFFRVIREKLPNYNR
jgi:hypothetical protein